MPFLSTTKKAPAAKSRCANTRSCEGNEIHTNRKAGENSIVNTLPSMLRPDDFFVSAVATRSVLDAMIEGEHGIDTHLEYNVQTNHAGEIEAAYYSLMFTPHESRSTSMLLLSPHKIPALIEALSELHDEWRQDVKRTTLSGITVESIFLDAQARGMKVTDVLAEVLDQLGIDDGKAV